MPAETERAWSILTRLEEFRWEAVGLWFVQKSRHSTLSLDLPLTGPSVSRKERVCRLFGVVDVVDMGSVLHSNIAEPVRARRRLRTGCFSTNQRLRKRPEEMTDHSDSPDVVTQNDASGNPECRALSSFGTAVHTLVRPVGSRELSANLRPFNSSDLSSP
jgi:hypothetical protein